MGSLAIALPVQPGKVEEARRLAREVHEDRSHHEHEINSAQGFSRVKVFLQTGRHNTLIVYMEGDDVYASAARSLRDDHEHEDWLRSQLEQIVDFAHPADEEELRSELLFDWHEEHGTALAEHSP